jgi:hypothetical protein
MKFNNTLNTKFNKISNNEIEYNNISISTKLKNFLQSNNDIWFKMNLKGLIKYMQINKIIWLKLEWYKWWIIIHVII